MTLEYLEVMNENVVEVKARKRAFPRFREFRDLANVEFFPVQEKEYKQAERNEKFETLLTEIYGVDPKTKLPIGDIAQYMSDNTNPQIRDFISKQLMTAFEPVGNSSQLSDEDLVRYERKSDESVRDYVARVASYVKDDAIAWRQQQQQQNVKPKED